MSILFFVIGTILGSFLGYEIASIRTRTSIRNKVINANLDKLSPEHVQDFLNQI